MALSIGQSNSFTDLIREGFKNFQGQDEVLFTNLQACNKLSQVIRTSMGPTGSNKLVVNAMQQHFITSDASTILTELDVIHPAAKLLMMAARQQSAQYSDMTNFVLTFGGDLLLFAQDLLRDGIKAADVVTGFEQALQIALPQLDACAMRTVEQFSDSQQLAPILRSAISSKQDGLQSLLIPIVSRACVLCMPKNPRHFNVDLIACVKILGGTVSNCSTANGILLGREPESQKKCATKGRVAVFACPIDVCTTETKGTVLMHKADEMLSFSKGEEASTEAVIREIAEAGFSVVVTNGTIGELMMHFINRYGLVAVRLSSKYDLKRLCVSIGATASARLGVPSAEEAGYCESVECVEIGGMRCTLFKQAEDHPSPSVSIVLRAGTQNQLEDLERAVNAGIAAVKIAAVDGQLVPGAGSTELQLARHCEAVASRTSGLAQYAIRAFGRAFESIPKALIENSGHPNPAESLSLLHSAHDEGKKATGVNVHSDEHEIPTTLDQKKAAFTVDAAKEEIFDLLIAKKSAITLATEAALTVLRVDQIIMSKQIAGPKPRAPGAQDPDD